MTSYRFSALGGGLSASAALKLTKASIAQQLGLGVTGIYKILADAKDHKK